ncbi:hypothetical protein F5Y05DRAFT_423642 [Hypoxylon sp. FL0543]|nr:hypothetical protein F5Y05DRAFT_423642 [Hypoxylon sp. FL0543]
MAVDRTTARLPNDWEVHTFQIGVPLGDCAIHLLVKNAVRYTHGDEFKVPPPPKKKTTKPDVLPLQQPMFRRIVELAEKDLPPSKGKKTTTRQGQGEVHAALLFDGGHDDDGPGYHGKRARASIERAISDIEAQYTFNYVADDVKGTPKRAKKTKIDSQLIFDAWVVTHWDRDHYCGSLTMFRDDVFGRWSKVKPQTQAKAEKQVCSYFKYGEDGTCNSTLYCPVWVRSTKDGEARGAPNIFVNATAGLWLTGETSWPLDLKIANATSAWFESAPLFKVVHGQDALIGIDLFTQIAVCEEKDPGKWWWASKKHKARSVVEGYIKKRKGEDASFDDKRPVFICVGSNGYAFGSKKPADRPTEHCTPDNYVSIMAMIIWKTDNGIRISHLCGGDAHAVTEELIVDFIKKTESKSKKDPVEYWPIEVMKASHHGARSSTPVELVIAARPSKFIISAGQSHGHPSWQTVALLATYYRSEKAKGGRAARVQERPLYNLQFPYYLPFGVESKPQHLRSVDVNLNSYGSPKSALRSSWEEAFIQAYGGTEEQEFYGDEEDFEEGLKGVNLKSPDNFAKHLWTYTSVLNGINCMFGKFANKSLQANQKALQDARQELRKLPKSPGSKKEKDQKAKAEAKVLKLFRKVEYVLRLQRAALARYMRCIWMELSQVLDYQKNSQGTDRGLSYLRLHSSAGERYDGRALPVGRPSNWTVLQQLVRKYSKKELVQLQKKITLPPSTKKKVVRAKNLLHQSAMPRATTPRPGVLREETGPRGVARLEEAHAAALGGGGGGGRMEEELPADSPISSRLRSQGRLKRKADEISSQAAEQPETSSGRKLVKINTSPVSGVNPEPVFCVFYTNKATPLEDQPSDIVRVNSKILGDWSTWPSDEPEMDRLALEMIESDFEELHDDPELMGGTSLTVTAAASVTEEFRTFKSKKRRGAQKRAVAMASKEQPVSTSIDGLVASEELLQSLKKDLQEKTFAVIDEETAGWDFLAWAGPMYFDQPAQVGIGVSSDFACLGEKDTTLEVLMACWQAPDLDGKAEDSYVRKMDVRCQLTAGDGPIIGQLDDVRLHLGKTKNDNPLVFSARKEVLDQQFELKDNPSSRAGTAGFERLPGHLLLGLEIGPHTGGFDSLKDLLDLLGIYLGIWMASLSSGVKFRIAQGADGFPCRNAFWYLPAKDYTSILRLCGTLHLDAEGTLGTLGAMVKKYSSGLTPQYKYPELQVVIKRSATPTIECGNTYIDAASEVTLWTELDIGSPKSVGLYFSLLSDRMVITVLSNSRGLTWSALKQWIAEKFQDLAGPLLSLEDDLAVLIRNRGPKDDKNPAAATAPEDLDGIFWHRLTLTVNENGELLGASITFEASMPYLVEKGKHAVFELSLVWSPGLYEFKGAFMPAAADPADPILDGYMIDHESWTSLIPLSANAAPFMSLRLIDPSNPLTEDKIPYGVPTEITECELYVSNEMTRVSGTLASVIKPPKDAGTSEVPTLQIDHVELHIEAELDYSNGSSQASFDLSGLMTLKSAGYVLDDPICIIRAAMRYDRGNWSFSAMATDVPMASLYSLFAPGPERDGVMQMLSQVHLDEIFIEYTYAGASVSQFKLGGSMTIAGVAASVEYNRSDKSDWKLQAVVEKNVVVDPPETKKPETLGGTLQALLGDDVVAILPDFVRNTTFPAFEPDHDHIQLTCSANASGVVLSIGKLHVQLGQLRVDKKDEGQEVVSVKRLVLVSLGPLPSTADMPLVGSISLPFDRLEFAWASDDFSKLELDALEAGAGFSEDASTRIRRSRDSATLSKGFHFRLVGDDEVWIDHAFTRKEQQPTSEPHGAVETGKGQIIAAAPNPAAAVPMKPIKKSRGGLSMSGIGISFDNDVLSIHLDASVTIGPISAGVQGLTIKLDLQKMGSLDQLFANDRASVARVEEAVKVSISGINVAFDRSPVLIAGGLEYADDEDGKMFAGDIAVSLTEFSIGAYGMYQELKAKPPIPAYNSFFVYAMVEGTLFTVGWAEIRGLVAGFGYNSMLRLPVGGGEELINYPLLKDLGPDFHSNMVALRKDGWVTPSIGSLWMAAGLKVRACQTMDIRAVATFSIGPDQKELGLLARASVALPRGSSRDKALMLIDLSIVGKLDFLHGELVINGAIEPTSFILHESCVPSGEFAIRSWFGSDNSHRGDWVVSFGGFHPAFVRPYHYPNPSRMQINWSVSKKVSVTGQGYVAVTPNAIMAGGLLHAAYKWEGVEATFDAHADFLVTMAPLHYTAEMEVFARVSYEFRKWCFTFKESVELAAGLRLYGPPLGGTVTIHVAFIHFDVDFGAGGGNQPPGKLSLGDFEALVRERSADKTKQNKAHVMAAISGLVSVKDKNDAVPGENKGDADDDGETKHWIVRGNDFVFTVRSCAPISSAKLGNDDTDQAQGHTSTILSRPMQMTEKDTNPIVSNIEVRVYRGNKTDDSSKRVNVQMQEHIIDRVPSNLWGAMPSDPRDLLNPNSSQTTVEHLVGFKMRAPTPETSASKLDLVLSQALPTTTITVAVPLRATSAVPVYLEAEDVIEHVKWKRVKAVLGKEGGPKQRKAVMDAFLSFFSRDKETAKAFRNIGTGASMDVAVEPEKFYRKSPNVLYRALEV